MMPSQYGNAYQILQTPEFVAIRYEMDHETRLIPLDGRPHANTVDTYMGESRGRWEGDTLVVETTGFRENAIVDQTRMGDLRPANPERLRVIERFTRVNATTVEWTVTFDDASTWVRPWTFSMPLTQVDHTQRIYEYACHEGNLAMRNILSGARAAEAAAAAAE